MPSVQRQLPWIVFAAAIVLPFAVSPLLVGQINTLIPLLILGLALNVVVGYTGMLHLGGAAFLAIGVFAAAISSSAMFPFQIGFIPAIIWATIFTAGCGVVLGAPTLRLRGDYLALVTLGFGEIVKDTLVNLPALTNGIKGIQQFPPPPLPDWWTNNVIPRAGGVPMYFPNLLGLVLVWWLLGNLERSRLGRALIALREDELAAQCMGLNTVRLKLAAFAATAAIAGFAGALFLFSNDNSLSPQNYDFNLSVMILAGVILGGIGNRAGVLLGVSLILGFDRIAIPYLTNLLNQAEINQLDPNKFKILLYGLLLILAMRFRPHGLWPERRWTMTTAAARSA